MNSLFSVFPDTNSGRLKWCACLFMAVLSLCYPPALQAQNAAAFTYITNQNGITITGGCPGSPGALVIPDTIHGLPVTGISAAAFAYCYSLSSVVIPHSVTSIGDSAFSGCHNLWSVRIPDSVTRIGNSAFSSCISLTNVVIPQRVTSIGNSAFRRCWILRSITIPNSVTSIGEWAFSECDSLPSITIPSSVTDIGQEAFYGCARLTAIQVNAGNSNYSSVKGVLFDKSQAVLIRYPGGLNGDYTIPTSVIRIGDSAFSRCTSLTNVVIPNGVTSIGDSAFSECSSLTNVVIPHSVTHIGQGTFNECTSLTSTTIPDGVTSLGDWAFHRCRSLTNVVIPHSVTGISQGAFSECASLTSITIPSSVTRIGNEAFRDCISLTNLVIPNSVTSLGNEAFSGCASLIRVTAGADLVPAVHAACRDSGRIDPASHLRFLIVNEHVVVTGHDYWLGVIDFWSSGPPIEVEIPPRFDGRPVSFILNSACQAMALSKVTIPASVSWIGEGAFASCRSLTRIDVAADNPFYRSVEGVLFDAPLHDLLQYPGARVGDFVVPAGVRRIGSDSFADCAGLTRVTIPDSVVEIGDRAFLKCSNLRYILFGTGIGSIGEQALDTRSYFCDSWGGPPCWGGYCGCHYYGAALELHFQGDAPAGGGFFGERGLPTRPEEAGRWQSYDLSPPPSVHYLPRARGWGTSFDGMPTTPWGGEPVFLSQPKSHSGYAGSVFQLSVRAVGPEPLRFQWEKDEVDVPGATNATLPLSSVRMADAGSWRVRVSNTYGAVTSQVASVMVRVPAANSYEAAAVALGPLAYWPLDEAGGETAMDFVTGSSGSFVGASGLGAPGATPNTGTSVNFGGEGSVVASPNPAWDVGTNDFTVAAWIYPTGYDLSGLVSRSGNGAYGWLFDFSVADEGSLRLEASDGAPGGQGTVRTPPRVVTLNEWQHVVVSCRRDPAAGPGLSTTGKGWTKIYRNGVQVAAGDIGPGNLNNPDLPFILGMIPSCAGCGDMSFPGRMDDVTLFGKALSAEQVADLYAAGFGAPLPLRIIRSGEQVTLTWSGGVLQSTTTLGNDGQAAGWSDLTATTSPYTLSPTNSASFFRVRIP